MSYRLRAQVFLTLLVLVITTLQITNTAVEAQSCSTTYNIASGDVNTLRNAINNCNFQSQAVTINLATNGTYTFSNVLQTSGLPDHALPIIYNTAGFTINGNGSTLTMANGLTMRFTVVARNNGTPARLELRNMTLQNGKLTASGLMGGAISNIGYLTLRNVNFYQNQAPICGAIHNDTSGSLTIEGGRYANNSASVEGGAVCTFGNTTITGTRTNTGDPLTDVFNTIFESNRAPAAGAILGYIHNTTMTRVKFSANYAYIVPGVPGSGLGAAMALDGGAYNLSEILVVDNIAEHNAGGVYITNATATISDSWFYRNVAGRNTSGTVTASDGSGGALFNDIATSSIYRTYFYNNRSILFGGAVNNVGTLTLEDAFFDASQGSFGAAIANIVGSDTNGNRRTGNITMRSGSQNRSVVRGTDVINYASSPLASIATFGPFNMTGTAMTGNDYLVDNPHGIWGFMVTPDATGTITLQNNCIVNTGGVSNRRNTSINATNNWWGSASGPAGLGNGTGDRIGDPTLITASPFATSPVNSCYPWVYSSTPPGAPTGLSTQGNLNTAPAQPTYRWNAVSNATGYYLYVINGSGQTVHAQFYNSGICSNNVCQVTPNTSMGAGSYQWKVAAYNSAGYGPYSGSASFSVITMPSAPTGLSTQGNLGSVPAQPTFRWNAVNTATGYYLYVVNSSGQAVHAQFYGSNICSSGICQVTPSLSLGAGTYVWKVAAYNAAGYGPYSSVVNFTVVTAPGTPGSLSTQGNLSSVPAQPTFRWNAVNTATGYYLYVVNSSGQAVHAQFYGSNICSSGICQVTPSLSLGAGTYVWKVAAYNAAGYGPYSGIIQFAVGGPPTAPTGLTTQGNLSSAPATPTYRWNAVGTAIGYYLYVATTSGGTVHGSFYDSSVCSGGVCQVMPNVNLSAGTYQWKVAAYNPAGYGPYSGIVQFTVGSAGLSFLELTSTVTATTVPTNVPTGTPLPTGAPTSTLIPTEPPTATTLPTEMPTSTQVPTEPPTTVPTEGSTEQPTVTTVPTEAPTSTQVPTEPPTATTLPTEVSTSTQVPLATSAEIVPSGE